jgi:pimeloyl-ACP methyl ester carboxylesterase
MNMRLFARQYPDEVVGIVLVDGLHEDIWARFTDDELETSDALLRRALYAQATARSGLARLASELGLQPKLEKLWIQLPPEVQPMVKANAFHPQLYSAVHSELASFKTSGTQVRDAGPLGDTPLVVLSNSGSLEHCLIPFGFPVAQSSPEWLELQADLAKLSSNSTLLVADGGDHLIPTEQTGSVIEAIQQVIEMAQSE